jgi:hypothetical protein
MKKNKQGETKMNKALQERIRKLILIGRLIGKLNNQTCGRS